MSTLLLIRHGQASVHGADYDVLSERGIEQSKRLGKMLADWDLAIDAVYTGPRQRHIDTERFARQAAAEHGLQLPEPTAIEELDEIDVGRLSGEAMARVLPSCPDLREQLASGAPNDDGRVAMHHMSRIMEKLMERWAQGTEGFGDVVPFEQFARRVRKGLERIMKAEGRGKTVAVFTSGGPISVATRLCLKLDPVQTVNMMFVLVNASVTELKFTEDRLTLASFNVNGHLRQGGLITRI